MALSEGSFNELLVPHASIPIVVHKNLNQAKLCEVSRLQLQFYINIDWPKIDVK